MEKTSAACQNNAIVIFADIGMEAIVESALLSKLSKKNNYECVSNLRLNAYRIS